VQGTWTIAGIGFDAFGDLVPSRHRYVAFAVIIQLGRLGN